MIFPWWPLLQTWACPYVSLCSSMSTGDWDLFRVPWNGRGRRLVELTNGCYSRGDFQVLPTVFKVTPLSLGYSLSVFNKNSTLNSKRTNFSFAGILALLHNSVYPVFTTTRYATCGERAQEKDTEPVWWWSCYLLICTAQAIPGIWLHVGRTSAKKSATYTFLGRGEQDGLLVFTIRKYFTGL